MKQSRAEVQKRHQHLLELFNAQGIISASEASKLLNVSELTIRRDFDVLENKGYITRFHGGAKLKTPAHESAPVFESRGTINQIQKQQIAQVVSRYIHEKDTVFLNAGTTTLEVIKYLKDKDITIITNNAPAFSIIQKSTATLISTGGEYNNRNKSYTGVLATHLINKVIASVCILGVNGLSYNDGITTSAYLETMINENMLKRCKGEKIVVADGSKIGQTFCFSSASISDIDILVTDSSADPTELKLIQDAGVKIILADKEVEL